MIKQTQIFDSTLDAWNDQVVTLDVSTSAYVLLFEAEFPYDMRSLVSEAAALFTHLTTSKFATIADIADASLPGIQTSWVNYAQKPRTVYQTCLVPVAGPKLLIKCSFPANLNGVNVTVTLTEF